MIYTSIDMLFFYMVSAFVMFESLYQICFSTYYCLELFLEFLKASASLVFI